LATLKLQATCPVPSVVSVGDAGREVIGSPAAGVAETVWAVGEIDVGKVDGAVADVGVSSGDGAVSTAAVMVGRVVVAVVL